MVGGADISPTQPMKSKVRPQKHMDLMPIIILLDSNPVTL